MEKKPLENYRDIDDFKIYLADMGLLAAQKNIRAEDIFFMEFSVKETPTKSLKSHVF